MGKEFTIRHLIASAGAGVIVSFLITAGISVAIEQSNRVTIEKGLEPSARLETKRLTLELLSLQKQEFNANKDTKVKLRRQAAKTITQIADILEQQNSILALGSGIAAAESSEKLVVYMRENSERLMRNEISIPGLNLNRSEDICTSYQ